MPPTAAAMDSAATRGFLSSPMISSRLSSKATTKKNSVISPSLIQCRAEWRRANGPSRNPTGISQKAKKPWAQDEFERASAVAVHSSRTAPPAVSMRRNRASGPVTRSMGSLGSRLSSRVVVVLSTHPCHPRCGPGVCSEVAGLPQHSDDSGPLIGAVESEIFPLLSSANRERDLHNVRIHITRTIPWKPIRRPDLE